MMSSKDPFLQISADSFLFVVKFFKSIILVGIWIRSQTQRTLKLLRAHYFLYTWQPCSTFRRQNETVCFKCKTSVFGVIRAAINRFHYLETQFQVGKVCPRSSRRRGYQVIVTNDMQKQEEVLSRLRQILNLFLRDNFSTTNNVYFEKLLTNLQAKGERELSAIHTDSFNNTRSICIFLRKCICAADSFRGRLGGQVHDHGDGGRRQSSSESSVFYAQPNQLSGGQRMDDRAVAGAGHC